MGLSGTQLIKVRATDRGTPSLHSDGFVEIRIGSSSGQQVFKFDNGTYPVHLNEDATKNTLVWVLNISVTAGGGGGGVKGFPVA